MWVSLEVQTWSSDCVQMATVAASVLTDNWQQTSLCTVVYQHLFALCNVWVTTTSYCNVSPEQWCTMRRYIIIVVSCHRHVLSPWCCHTQFRQLNTHFVKCHIQAVFLSTSASWVQSCSCVYGPAQCRSAWWRLAENSSNHKQLSTPFTLSINPF
jgi:hypothetical protein